MYQCRPTYTIIIQFLGITISSYACQTSSSMIFKKLRLRKDSSQTRTILNFCQKKTKDVKKTACLIKLVLLSSLWATQTAIMIKHRQLYTSTKFAHLNSWKTLTRSRFTSTKSKIKMVTCSRSSCSLQTVVFHSHGHIWSQLSCRLSQWSPWIRL